MRSALRLFANVKVGRFLEAGNPTGLCGVYNHPLPQPALIYYYKTTLDKLKQLPESSVYRQSTEALTKHRLQIVESLKPQGQEHFEATREKLFTKYGSAISVTSDKTGFIINELEEDPDDRVEEWNGEGEQEPELEGPRTSRERRAQNVRFQESSALRALKVPAHFLEELPRLNADQVNELENKLGAGLIEEVIDVAEGELNLIDKMVEDKVWEELVEKPAEGQWTYFERKAE